MQRSLKDQLSGLIFIAFGLSFGYAAWSYDLGSALRMGPGFFPVMLAGVLVVLGIATIVEGTVAGDRTEISGFSARGFVLIIGALLFFGFTVRGLGLAPALFGTVLMAAFASRRTGIVAAFVLAFGLPAFCVAIFTYGLGVPVPVFGPWWPL